MKKLIIYTALIGLLVSACEEEDSLTPSLLDENRVEVMMDQQSEYGSQPLIEEWYETYNTAVLFEYQDTLDFIYQASSQSANNVWLDLSFPQISTLFLDEEGNLPSENIEAYMDYVEKGLVFLDTTIFDYITPGSTIAGMMPHKMLISASLSGDASSSHYWTEGDYGVPGYKDANNFHSVFNTQAMVFNVNQDNLELGADNYIKDNFYLFLCKLYVQNDLYEEFNDEIYKYSEPYFNTPIMDAYIDDYGEDQEDWTELTPNGKVPLSWFLSKGFVDAEGFYNFSFKTYTESTYPVDENGDYILAGPDDAYGWKRDADGNWIKALKVVYYHDYINVDINDNDDLFLEDKAEFIRSYTNQVLYRTYDELSAYPDNVQTSLKLTANTLIDWGIDLVSFNPELEQFLNE
ncbi:hypothetical protein J1N10_07680 [Carboxylicivirga sp. A043]|uniref:hypothetical protein n=1 Tax=Carboxylicivirga litoralis TaxID=2816963 RepID=UPI0021CB377F|nr:hypothetical protein [Carboxylicivirga sp. A043]MCU4155854.1 hypothetical protein [Carboxylicivirga sp. A043]